MPVPAEQLEAHQGSERVAVEVSASGLTKTYESHGGLIAALDRVDLEVGAGEFVSILGPSGCGKSTLLSMLAGLESPTSGTVHIAGRPVRAPVVDAGFMFQKDLLLEWRTCERNVLLQFEMRGQDWRPHRGRALELLEMVGLRDFGGRHPSQLSGGMRQRVALCRALVHSPSVLFMDEPFGALDALTREDLNTELRQLAAQHRMTVLFVTHSIDEAVFLSDRVLVLSPRPGRIVGNEAIALPEQRDASVRTLPAFTQETAHLRRLLSMGSGAGEEG